MRRVFPLLLLLALGWGWGWGEDPDRPRTIHALVALCDNENQGIVRVPKVLGNGRDPENNLYWGARYGVKTSLKKLPDWNFLGVVDNPPPPILERIVFKRKDAPVYLIADAYDGAEIRQAIIDFLNYAAGLRKMEILLGTEKIPAGGAANLMAFVGHNGLMDFSLETGPGPADSGKREAIVLACASKPYFSSYLRKSGAQPLLWTTGLMSPEAYTLIAAVEAWIRNDLPEKILEKAARAYDKYQKCGLEGAKRLFATGY